MDEEENNQVDLTEQSPSSSNGNSISNKAKKDMTKKLAETYKKFGGAKQSLMKAIAHILAPVIGVILIIVIIIGIVMFLITMPGMVMDQLKEYGKSIGKAIASFFGQSTVGQVDNDAIYEIIDYLDDMGYDLRGYGILTGYVSENLNDDEVKDALKDENNQIDYEDEVIRDENDNIVYAMSDFIKFYLISDNYVYTISNFNTENSMSEKGKPWYVRLAGGAVALGQRLVNVLTLNQSAQLWSEGMLDIYYEKQIGVKGAYYGDGPFGWNDIDLSNNKLSIKRGWGSNSVTYNLEGWTGRYGVPVDLLLTIHLATLMPDLAVDIATSFNTKVQILLHSVTNGDVETAYDNGKDKITYSEFDDIVGLTVNPLWLGTIGLNKKEARQIMNEFDIESQSSGKYGCTGTQDATVVVWPTGISKGAEDTFDSQTKENVIENSKFRDTEYTSWKSLVEAGTKYNKDNEISGYKTVDGADLSEIKKIKDKIIEAWEYLDANYEPIHDTEIYNRDIWSGYLKDVMKRCFDSGGLYSGFSVSDVVEIVGKNNDGSEICNDIELGTWKTEIDGEEIAIILELRLTKTTTDNNVDFSLVAYRDMSAQEVSDKGITIGSNLCSDNPNNKKVCPQCARYIRQIYRYLKQGNDENFDTYIPYISKVTDHWYRDVYYAISDTKASETGFVSYDYDYEALTQERWTLYETDSNGDYVYYVLNEDGSTGDVYTGKVIEGEQEVVSTTNSDDDSDSETIRISSTGEDGTKVVKKAVTININGTDEDGNSYADDLGWNKLGTSWSAYQVDESDPTPTDWEQVYPDSDDEIKQKIFYSMTISGNIEQTGEGQRTETNSKIKKMFLNNYYFRYDGTAETAEIITKLRNDNNIEYGALSSDDLKKTTDITENGETTTYKVSDYAGQVTLNQDSLNVFSMLENTHTLDSDYIYRDLKELIVELGYFTKEELTDEIPQVLEFPIPEISSSGFPTRSLDKRENEYGTMIHSKGDLEANEKNTLVALIKNMTDLPDDPPDSTENSEETTTAKVTVKNINSDTIDILGNVASLETTPIDTLKTVGGITNVSAANYSESLTDDGETGFKPKGTRKEGVKTGDLTFNGVNYEMYTQTHDTCTLNAFAFIAQAYVPDVEFIEYVTDSNGTLIDKDYGSNGGNDYWVENTGVKHDMFEKAGIAGTWYDEGNPVNASGAITTSLSDAAEVISAALEEGKPIWYYSGYGASATCHAVVLMGANESGQLLLFNPWMGRIIAEGTSTSFESNLNEFLSYGTSKDIHSFFIPDELPTGINKSATSGEYEGYEGNEAVVSPVTGLLLEYGEVERQNVDLKSGMPNSDISNSDSNSTAETTTTETSSEDSTESTSNSETSDETSDGDGRIVYDKVGYAKIFVLNYDVYQQLEANMIGKTDQFSSDTSFVSSTGNFLEYSGLKTKDDLEDWTIQDETLYGYKEFAELYTKSGIAGYIIYIDGFKCELPDTSYDSSDPDAVPSGEKLTLDSFKLSIDDLEDGSDLIKSKYIADDEYKMASQSATDKLNAETKVKTDASPAVYIDKNITGTSNSDDSKIKGVFIKEGTVIGRTFTDRELVTQRLENGDDSQYDYDYYRSTDVSQETGDNTYKLIGNYIKISMVDTDLSYVEDIEEYMKLGTSTGSMQELDDEKFLYWLGCYGEGGNLEEQNGKWVSVPVDLSDGAGATHYFGLTHYNLDLAKKLGYDISDWGANLDLEMLVDIYLALIEEQKAQIKSELGDDISDGYLQAFISILHNYGNFTKRGTEYKQNGSVSETTWCTYEGTQYAEALTKRRVGEWLLITEGKYMNFYDGNTSEIDFTNGGKYSEETPFTDFCKEYGVTNIEVKKTDE